MVKMIAIKVKVLFKLALSFLWLFRNHLFSNLCKRILNTYRTLLADMIFYGYKNCSIFGLSKSGKPYQSNKQQLCWIQHFIKNKTYIERFRLVTCINATRLNATPKNCFATRTNVGSKILFLIRC